jgi:hypothetical protein
MPDDQAADGIRRSDCGAVIHETCRPDPRILLVVVLLAAAGTFAYASMQAKARLARTWPDVKGTEVPVPWPLTAAEVTALRESKQAEVTPEAATVDAAADPLAGVDLTAIAMERAIERGHYLMTVRLGCAECHGHDLTGSLVADAQPVWTWYCPNITRGGLTKDFKSADWDRAVRHASSRTAQLDDARR